jgi:hypothetical protein
MIPEDVLLPMIPVSDTVMTAVKYSWLINVGLEIEEDRLPPYEEITLEL